MKREERTEDIYAAILFALQGLQADIQTALPAIIQSFDPAKRTCTAKPTIKFEITNPDQSTKWVELPVIVDIPVIFPSGGGYTLTFPIAQGDECLLVFASRCIDSWWYSGGYQNQHEFRMHDLSDGFAFVGVNSRPNVISSISTNSTQLRSNDGAAYVELAGGHIINVVAPGGFNVIAPTINLQATSSVTLKTPQTNVTGGLTGTGVDGSTTTFAGEGTFNGHTVGHHTHTDPQGGSVGLPTG